jgi:hypothetical protein
MINPIDFFAKCQVAFIKKTDLETKVQVAAGAFFMPVAAHVIVGVGNLVLMIKGKRCVSNDMDWSSGILLYLFYATVLGWLYRADGNSPPPPQNSYIGRFRNYLRAGLRPQSTVE